MLDPLVWIALIGLLGLGALDGWRRVSTPRAARSYVRPTVRVHKVDVTHRRE